MLLCFEFLESRRCISEVKFERKHICNIHAYEYNFIKLCDDERTCLLVCDLFCVARTL